MQPLRRHITKQNVTNKDDGTCYYKMTEPFNERSEEGKGEEKCEDVCVRVRACVGWYVCRRVVGKSSVKSGRECETVANSLKVYVFFMSLHTFMVISVLTPVQLAPKSPEKQ